MHRLSIILLLNIFILLNINIIAVAQADTHLETEKKVITEIDDTTNKEYTTKKVTPDSIIKKYIENAELIGVTRMNYLFMHIYDIELHAKDKFSWENKLALKLTYKRLLYGKKIAKSSADEIEKLGFNDEEKLADWQAQMEKIFPDVEDGDVLIGIYEPGGASIFYDHEKQLGIVKDPEFGKWFFGIWLNEKTSRPKLREKLIN
ncbi:MAG: chalcone isomerase family protein [Pseudomonadota bacterium]